MLLRQVADCVFIMFMLAGTVTLVGLLSRAIRIVFVENPIDLGAVATELVVAYERSDGTVRYHRLRWPSNNTEAESEKEASS